jgi:hypothetical protein
MATTKKETSLVSTSGNIEISGKGKDLYAKLNEFVKESLIENEHYGKVPGSNKPSLFKGGAELLAKEADLVPTFEILNEKIDFDTPFFAQMVKCTLHKDGEKISEATGACNSKERKFVSNRIDQYFLYNNVPKMAEKRAYVSAVVRAWGLSGIFTQDMEDLQAEAPPVEKETIPTDTNKVDDFKKGDEFKDLRSKYFSFKGIREMNEEQRHNWNKSQIGKESTKAFTYRDWLKAIELLVYRESKLEFTITDEIPEGYETPQEKALRDDPEAKKILPHFTQNNDNNSGITSQQLKAIGKLCEMKGYQIKENLDQWTVDQAGQAITFLNDN